MSKTPLFCNDSGARRFKGNRFSGQYFALAALSSYTNHVFNICRRSWANNWCLALVDTFLYSMPLLNQMSRNISISSVSRVTFDFTSFPTLYLFYSVTCISTLTSINVLVISTTVNMFNPLNEILFLRHHFFKVTLAFQAPDQSMKVKVFWTRVAYNPMGSGPMEIVYWDIRAHFECGFWCSG